MVILDFQIGLPEGTSCVSDRPNLKENLGLGVVVSESDAHRRFVISSPDLLLLDQSINQSIPISSLLSTRQGEYVQYGFLHPLRFYWLVPSEWALANSQDFGDTPFTDTSSCPWVRTYAKQPYVTTDF